MIQFYPLEFQHVVQHIHKTLRLASLRLLVLALEICPLTNVIEVGTLLGHWNVCVYIYICIVKHSSVRLSDYETIVHGWLGSSCGGVKMRALCTDSYMVAEQNC